MSNDQQAAAVVEVAMDWTVEASVHDVWDQLTANVASWWPSEHRAVSPQAAMQLDARVGGTLTEVDDEQGGIEWYRVVAVVPRKSIDLVGQLASRYGGPATSMLHISLEAGPERGTTTLRLTDSVFGRIGPDLRASLTSGWEAIVGAGLLVSLGKSVAR